MNIFKILSLSKGSINEENISSFLSFILNSKQNSYGDVFLINFLSPLILKNKKHFKNLIYKESLTAKDRIKPFEKDNIDINIIREFGINLANKKEKRFIDIVIEIVDEKSGIKHYICIENKINNSAIKNKKQLLEQVIGIENVIDEDMDTKISLIFITPKKDKISTEVFEKLESKKDIVSSHYSWSEESGISILKILQNILKEEMIGDIDPIDQNMKYLLKSFINFIKNDFKISIESSYNNKVKYFTPNFLKLKKTDYKSEFIKELKEYFIKKDKELKIVNYGVEKKNKNGTYYCVLMLKGKVVFEYLKREQDDDMLKKLIDKNRGNNNLRITNGNGKVAKIDRNYNGDKNFENIWKEYIKFINDVKIS